MNDARSPSGPRKGNTALAESAEGYILVRDNGETFAFGGVAATGRLLANEISAPVAGIAGSPGGDGYWIALKDGVVHAFGSAEAYRGLLEADTRVVGIVATGAGDGYFLAGSDGAVSAFGAARVYGDGRVQMPGRRVVSIAAGFAGPGMTVSSG